MELGPRMRWWPAHPQQLACDLPCARPTYGKVKRQRSGKGAPGEK